MSQEHNTLDRRGFLALGAAAGLAAPFASPALAGGLAQSPANGSADAKLTAMPFPEKLRSTAPAGISAKTHEEHFKLYTGYINKVNEIREKLGAMGNPDPAKANQTFSDIRELKVEYTFALGGVKNHELYFDIMGGRGGNPTGAVGDAINAAFGSYDAFKADMKATGVAARGWVWLAHDYTNNTLFNYIGDAQNTFPMWHCTPILALDVYEHAYWLDFQTGRAKYIDAFFSVLDWDAVNKYYAKAVAVYTAARV